MALISFVIYLRTLAPGVDWIDAGELATDCYTLGIAHPTGYPLFSLVGFLFSHLPIAGSVIERVNIMAAFFTALGAGATTLLMHEIAAHWMDWTPVVTRQQTSDRRKKGKKGAAEKREPAAEPSEQRELISAPTIAAIAAGLTAAFSATWWDQSTSIEVYPLHLTLVPLVLWAFLRMLRRDAATEVGLTRNAVLFSVLLGLSFSNHLTTIFLAPATLVLYFVKRRFTAHAFKQLAWLAVPFLATLLLYLYLPIRASMDPLMDWGHPTSLGALYKHMSGGQYKIWMFKGSASDQWMYFWQRAPIEFGLLGFVLSITGVGAILAMAGRKRWELLLFIGLLFFGCVLFAMNYGIHDIDSYFLVAYLAMALWIGCAINFLQYQLRRNPQRMIIAMSAVILIVSFEVYTNFADADESGNHMVDDYTLNMLNNLPPHSIIFSTQWDFWVSSDYYYQLIEKLRPDVLLIDKAMLHDRNWYHRYLRKRAPDVMNKVTAEEDAFLKYLDAFDADEPYDHVAIGRTYSAFIDALIRRNSDRPIFLSTELLDDRDDPFVDDLKRIPAGICWRLMPRDTVLDVPLRHLKFRGAEYPRRNYYTDNSRYFQAAPLAATAQWLAQHGRVDKAIAFAKLALQFAPDASDKAMKEVNPRDLEAAEATNERFARIEALYNELERTNRTEPATPTR